MPIAPDGHLNGTIDSVAYSSFQIDIFCASGSLAYDSWKTILHVTAGSDWGDIGSRVFYFSRDTDSETIFVASPGGVPGNSAGFYTCVANTYSNYKITVSPDESDNSRSVVELFIDGVLVNILTYNKVKSYS